jgi:hypothetical protein
MPHQTTASGAVTATERSNHEIVLAQLRSCVGELATHYELGASGVDALDGPFAFDEQQAAAMVGFIGGELDGALAIRAPSTLIARCLLTPCAIEPTSQAIGDAIAELANQLLGRMKNKLLPYQAISRVTCPLPVTPDELTVVGTERERTTWLRVATTAGGMLVILELHAPVPLIRTSDPEDPAITEGEMVLF